MEHNIHPEPVINEKKVVSKWRHKTLIGRGSQVRTKGSYPQELNARELREKG